MKNVPHPEYLVAMYLLMVAVPVYFVHTRLKKRADANKTPLNLLLYLAGVIGSAVLLHSTCMWLYFRYVFTR